MSVRIMAIQSVNASLRGPRVSAIEYDIVAAIDGAGLAKAGLSTDLAQRLTPLIVSRHNWLTSEVSAGHMQLAASWSVDPCRVKRIEAALRILGVLAVKRAGRKGLVRVYCPDLTKIADITRPFWHVLGADIARGPTPRRHGPTSPGRSASRDPEPRGDAIIASIGELVKQGEAPPSLPRDGDRRAIGEDPRS